MDAGELKLVLAALIFWLFVIAYFFTGYQKKLRRSYESFALKNDFTCDVGAAPIRRLNKILNGSPYFPCDSQGNIEGYGSLFIWGKWNNYNFSAFLYSAVRLHQETVVCVSIPDGDFSKFSINSKGIKFSKKRKAALLGDAERKLLSEADILRRVEITVGEEDGQKVKVPMRFFNKYVEFKGFEVEVLDKRLLLYRVNSYLGACPDKLIDLIDVATQLADALTRWPA